jgi:hypothetical protein
MLAQCTLAIRAFAMSVQGGHDYLMRAYIVTQHPRLKGMHKHSQQVVYRVPSLCDG